MILMPKFYSTCLDYPYIRLKLGLPPQLPERDRL